MRRTRWVAAGAATVAAVAAVVAAVGAGVQGGGGSGADSPDATSAGGADTFVEGGANESVRGNGLAFDTASKTTTLGLPLEQAAVIRTGSLSLSTPNLGKAQASISGLLASLDGYLASESTQASTDGDIRSAALVLKVPSDNFDVAMERLTQVGDVRSRTQAAKDVTRLVADVDSRVASARAALERIRLLLDRANSLGTVIRLESVLSDRQAELESLLAQQKTLASQTQMSTIDVALSVQRSPAVVPPQESERGFVTGLSKGWDAFTTMVLGLATAVGAMLPFALLLLLLGVPAWLLFRRLRAQQRRNAAQAG